MKPCPWTMAELLPHAPPMLLLDSVIGYDHETVEVAVTVSDRNPFAGPEGVPAHVGIELMAQACGAWVGAMALEKGLPVRMGYLLGTRRYACSVFWFPPGQDLSIQARMVFGDGGMGVFDCRIAAGEEVLAEAQLSLYQPGEGE